MTETKLDPKEQKYKQLRKLGQELHIPIPEAFIELEVTDKDGKVIQRHKQRSHSWTRNAYNLLLGQMASLHMADATFGAGLRSIKDTGGTVRTGRAVIGDPEKSWEIAPGDGYVATAAVTLYGIQVGSGTNAESFEDYVLQTLIAEGTGAGELNYVTIGIPTKSYAALVWTITWLRYMNNNSGGDVSVNEVALCAKGLLSGTNYYFINSRDKLASTVTIPDTGQLKVTYTIQLTYPS